MRRPGEALFMIGIGYLVFASFGAPWFPWDVLSAMACTAAGFHLGEFRHRWWPRGPVHDSEHGRFVEVDEPGSPKP